jgi:hypothetical protein
MILTTEKFRALEEQTRNKIARKQWLEALALIEQQLDGDPLEMQLAGLVALKARYHEEFEDARRVAGIRDAGKDSRGLRRLGVRIGAGLAGVR